MAGLWDVIPTREQVGEFALDVDRAIDQFGRRYLGPHFYGGAQAVASLAPRPQGVLDATSAMTEYAMGDIASDEAALRQLSLLDLAPGGGASKMAAAGALGAIPLSTRAARLPPTRLSTRNPTAVKAVEDPHTRRLDVGVEEFQASPAYEHNVGLLSGYPGFGRLAEMSPDEAVDAYIDQATGNLRFINESLNPDVAARSALWYDGANAVSSAWAKRYGLPRSAVSGVIATLSPQKDWFQNASLAERLLDTLAFQGGTRMTSEMAAAQQAIPALRSSRVQPIFERIAGKRLDQLTEPTEQALWIRLYDEAHNPRAYRLITPEGKFGDPVTTQSGAPRKVAWGSLVEISKAVRAANSAGDLRALSDVLGERHKVRSFYNNVEVPNQRLFGDVTADTHAVGAAQLRPVSQKSPAVSHNFGQSLAVKDQPPGYQAARGSSIQGLFGTYPMHVEPYRRLADETGLLPRQTQSVQWEAIRGLFPDAMKVGKLPGDIDAIWRAYDAGDISIDQARAAIVERAGGFRPPDWAERGGRVYAPHRASTYQGIVR